MVCIELAALTYHSYSPMESGMMKLFRNSSDIDEKISANAKGWKIERIAKAELAILRLAFYEGLYEESVPVGVAVNEAVELAKEYGGENGAAFVNGILGKIVNE